MDRTREPLLHARWETPEATIGTGKLEVTMEKGKPGATMKMGKGRGGRGLSAGGGPMRTLALEALDAGHGEGVLGPRVARRARPGAVAGEEHQGERAPWGKRHNQGGHQWGRAPGGKRHNQGGQGLELNV